MTKKVSTFSTKKVWDKNHKTKDKNINLNKNRANNVFDNQEIKQDLQFFYNKEAKKYAETRKKFWNEEKAILNEITPLFNQDKKVRILEFGCGSWRFATLLNNNFNWKFEYIWIDLSSELLNFASNENPNLTFFQWDITKMVKRFEQESFDLIVWTSSFQHIPTMKERSYLMKNFYRLLDYDGMLLMTNWSLSNRFIKKNWKSVIKSRILWWITFNKSRTRDIIVPRTDNKWVVYNRYYHFFSHKELENLSIFSGLNVKVNKWINQEWELIDNEKESRSSILVATKNPIIN